MENNTAKEKHQPRRSQAVTATMETKNSDTTKYEASLGMAESERQTLWQIFSGFLIAQTVLLAILLSKTQGDVSTWNNGRLIAALIGVALTFLWMAIYSRSYGFYKLHMLQVRDAEPDGWNLAKGDGKRFSEGAAVCAGGEEVRLRWVGRLFTTRIFGLLIMWVFLVAYVVCLVLPPLWRYL